MTNVVDLPVRWCPNPLCGAGSSIHADEWMEIERRNEQVVCANCCRVPHLWLKTRP